ncbi:MAG: DNA polymerase III subunit gamma/tau, partial [Actinomycetes bacterium]
AFQSLYRKYRPQRFDALVGQEPVTTALRNAVREGRVGHAYLFSGPRGTGKTTSARILAKALNCTDLAADGEPCDACANCTGIAAGTFPDLIELDAASNRGVQEARDLVSRISLGLGAGSSRKVYILDEVHMLTTEASNTLLKTLEEPPDHVVFVLATTDPQKVLPTIRSRTQHFEFSLLSVPDLTDHLAHILDLEGVEYERDALDVVARAAAGSARDSLSLLDQALAHADGRLSAEQVARAFGGSPFALRLAVLEAVAAEDAAGVLVRTAELLASGHDPRRIAEDLLRALRDAFLLVAGRGRVEVDAPEEEREQLRAAGEALGTAALVRALETLGQAVVGMRGSEAADPRLVLEVALVRLARRDTGTPLQALADRVDRLERALADGRVPASSDTAPAAPPSTRAPAAAAPPAPAAPTEPVGAKPGLGALRGTARSAPTPASEPPVATPDPGAEAPAASSDAPFTATLDDVIVAWAQVLESIPRAVRASVQEAQPLSVHDGVVTFGVGRLAIDSVKPKFQKEAPAIREGFLATLGQVPKFLLVAHDVTVEAPPSVEPAKPKRKRPEVVAPEPERELEEEVHPDDISDEVVNATVESRSRIEAMFDATIVEEHET